MGVNVEVQGVERRSGERDMYNFGLLGLYTGMQIVSQFGVEKPAFCGVFGHYFMRCEYVFSAMFCARSIH
jgi:hypothetical protein